MTEFDINLLRGFALILLIVAFLAMWKWAWSDKRKADFKAMSQLPLEDDQGNIPEKPEPVSGDNNGSKE
jgi:cbb3-type cytochrome oxidase subunit 3